MFAGVTEAVVLCAVSPHFMMMSDMLVIFDHKNKLLVLNGSLLKLVLLYDISSFKSLLSCNDFYAPAATTTGEGIVIPISFFCLSSRRIVIVLLLLLHWRGF
jgi:hypothetical protein